MESTDTQVLDQSSLLSQLGGSLSDMMPLLMISLGVSTLAFIVIAVMSAVNHRRQRRAIIQTAEDIHAIRELLEKKTRPVEVYPQVRSRELEDDPQLPVQTPGEQDSTHSS